MKVILWKEFSGSDVAWETGVDALLRKGFRYYLPDFPLMGEKPPIPVATETEKPKRRRRRRRQKNKITQTLINEMTALRKRGLLYRTIGKRYGVTGARAWQIINQGG